ncbi:MAG: type II toxin-antitoxin system RelE/ParE family toxin [Bacteroidaceae bacterium]|nr:type II toxin-antitoxin system RelE/ParE family toxin [Bacteroidaceae bacterium]
MGTLKIVVRKDALAFIEKTTEWYDSTMGHKAALHFVTGIYETIHRLAEFPRIGTLDERRSTEKLKYYSFLSHPKYRVVYRFTQRTLYIVAIRATVMNR